MDYNRHAPSVIHSVTMSMVNMLLLIVIQQPSEIEQPLPIQVRFHINILGVHFDNRKRLEKANCSWMRVDRCTCIHICIHHFIYMQIYTHTYIKYKHTYIHIDKAYYSYLPSNVQRLFTRRKIAYSMRASHDLERQSVCSTMRAMSL